MPQDNETTPETAKETWNETIKTIFWAVLIALVFRSFLFEPFHIPSGSMKDTLLVGDYLFVSKYTYGYSRYSFPMGFPLFKGRVFESPPQRGDVVVFRPPGMPNVDFVKRVVGLPGDRIQMQHSELYINGERVPSELNGFYNDQDGNSVIQAKRYIETLPNSTPSAPGIVHDTLDRGEIPEDPGGFSADNTAVYSVPAGHYFMMGDNRDNSVDSRFQHDVVGYVPEENIVGKARFILFSIGGDTPFWEFWRWPFEIRWDRFVHDIR